MLKPHNVANIVNNHNLDKATNNLRQANNEIKKGNQAIRRLSSELAHERQKSLELQPLSEAMKTIRDFEGCNPYFLVATNIIESAHEKWRPRHQDEVVNPKASPEQWQLSIKGKRNHNLYLIALTEHLYNVKSAPRNALEWNNWIIEDGNHINEKTVQALAQMNERVKHYSSSPTRDINKHIMRRFNELRKIVAYKDKNSTVPEFSSLPNPSEDAQLEKIVGKETGVKSYPTKKNVTECIEWETTAALLIK